MLKYKYVQTANGREMYFKNGKMVSGAEIPVSIKNILEPGVELTMPSPEETTPPEQTSSTETVDAKEVNQPQLERKEQPCVFCGAESKGRKFINLIEIPICQEDRNTHTTGEIYAQYRERTSADEENNQTQDSTQQD